MNFTNKNPIFYNICGKRGSGKSEVAKIIEKIYKEKGKKCLNLQYSYYVKQYAKHILNWDGSEQTKPRDFLNNVGVELIKDQIDERMLIRRLIEDAKIYSYFFSCITISDTRFIEEIEDLKKVFPKVITIYIESPYSGKYLTEKQKKHRTNHGLEGYHQYDYVIHNSQTILELEQKIKKMIEEVDKMNIKDIYLNFFKEKGHVVIPSAPVVPENDPTSLFNTAGMQPLVPYLTVEEHPAGSRLVDVQKCFRTIDLDEVGDATHHTFFEMLGNWSLGDYFKEESISWSFELLTEKMQIPIEKLAVTVFAGDETIPRDEESATIWKELGVKEDRISYLHDNFWIAGDAGPCGPDTEIFYWRSKEPVPEKHDPEDERWVEIWNNVFMQYYKHSDGTITELSKKNVDTGMGVERITSVLEGVNDNYTSSIWKDVIEKIELISHKNYTDEVYKKSMRIVADHIRAVVMIAGDNAQIKPSNTDQGYILRRLIRRMIRYAKKLEIDINSDWDKDLALLIIQKYKNYYKELECNQEIILDVLQSEKSKFNSTLEKGLREFDKLVDIKEKEIKDEIAFKLYDTYGFPIELTIELANEKGLIVNLEGFYQKFREHQEKSRMGSKEKFKGGLSSDSEMNIKYHTATHLLNAALRKILGNDVHQRGSNITDERMRFDFSCDHKLTEEEKTKVEEQVNEWIQASLPVVKEEMTKEEALQTGAEAMFIEKYGDVVTVYSIGDVSKELCGGPHVKNTSELGIFKIKKEEASSAGVRRIKAVLL